MSKDLVPITKDVPAEEVEKLKELNAKFAEVTTMIENLPPSVMKAAARVVINSMRAFVAVALRFEGFKKRTR